jgi:predicted component of type VI protein secretion system
MSQEQLGELVPIGGGDAIPLLQDVMTIGRRHTADIRLDFPNVSSSHAELTFRNGVWYVRDLGSTNGVKVNGERTQRRPLRPGDEVSVANHRYTIQYHLPVGSMIEEIFSEEEDVFGQSLLEKAGLVKPKQPNPDE